MSSTPASTNDYRSAARDKFEALKKLYVSNDTLPPNQQVSFWKLGNSFDTMIDFLDTIDASSARDVATMAVKQFKASLERLGGYDKAWFDDFGWWTVATQRALQKPFFKQDAEPLQEIRDECWLRFSHNAPFVWERCNSKDLKDYYAPAVDGGVWNAYWPGTPDTYHGPRGDPSSGLAGIQNTVTNALHLMAAYRFGHGQAEREREFLFKWFDEKDKEKSLWWNVDKTTGAGLVRERVSHYANGFTAQGFQTDWAWTGDQGLILGFLSDAIFVAVEPGRDVLIALAKNLLRGVSKGLVDHNVVQNWTTTGEVPSDDTSDYQVGAGVFWRNCLYVWKKNDIALRPFLKAEYKEIVQASADAAANALPPLEGTIETLTNQTAVLVAATEMLE
jgi:hypothetical protein